MEEKPKRSEAGYDQPCLICGRTDYEWGKYNQNGFTMSPIMRIGGNQARRCTTCGNLQIFHKPPHFPEVGSQ